MSRLGAIRRAITLERLLPLAIVGGALILIGSEFTDTFRLEAPGDTTLGLEDASDRHSWAIAVLGLCTLAAVTIAVVDWLQAGGDRDRGVRRGGPAGLPVDRPARCGEDRHLLDSPNNPFVQTKAEPEGGFWLLLIGSLVVAVCGIAFATLSPEQLRSLRPGSRPAPPRRSGEESAEKDGKRPVPPWGRRRKAAEDSGNGGKIRSVVGGGSGRRPEGPLYQR